MIQIVFDVSRGPVKDAKVCYRSLPRPRARKQDPAVAPKSANPAETTPLAAETIIDDDMQGSLLCSEQGEMIGDTPRSQTVSRLAALQVGSPGYTPSPMPLRRRLQNRGGVHEAAVAESRRVKPAECDVICIDC